MFGSVARLWAKVQASRANTTGMGYAIQIICMKDMTGEKMPAMERPIWKSDWSMGSTVM